MMAKCYHSCTCSLYGGRELRRSSPSADSGRLLGLQITVSKPKTGYGPELHQILSLVSQLGFIMMACILGGFGIGLYLDRLLGTLPLLLILFMLAGIGCGFWRAYVLIMRVVR